LTARTFSTTSLHTGRVTSSDESELDVPVGRGLSLNFSEVTFFVPLSTLTSFESVSLTSMETVIVPGFDLRSVTFPVTSTVSPTRTFSPSVESNH